MNGGAETPAAPKASEAPVVVLPSSENRMTIRTPGPPVSKRLATKPLAAPAVGHTSLADLAAPPASAPVPAVASTASTRPASAPTVFGTSIHHAVVVATASAKPANVTADDGKPPVVTIRAGNAATSSAANASSDPSFIEAAHAPFRVGAYEVAARIARGGMGSLYVCRNAGSGQRRLMTLKVVRQYAVQHDLAAASFRHEALIGSMFRHPNAQTVVDAGVHEGQPFLIFDYLDGGSLADMMLEETWPTPGVVVSIVLDVLAALHAMHQAKDRSGRPLGLVHCDVSPENVLVGVDGVARLADFGSARFTAVKNESQPFAVSKPPYMPPEQFRGDKLDSRSDIYSTGVLLWTALARQQPFAAEGYDETVINVMRKKIKPPSAHGAPRALDDICMQALSRSPDGRFVVAGGMAAALRREAEAQNLIETREQIGQWVRRAMGDELALRHRLIESMFSRSRVPTAKGGTFVRGTTLPTTRAADAPRERTPTPPQGQRVASARRKTGRHAHRKPRLTEQQRTIIALACAFAFAVTVTIGFGISRGSRADSVRASRPASAALQGSVGSTENDQPEGMK